MGYRLYIVGESNQICCGKLFGYSATEYCRSYKWLIEEELINEDTYFGYGYDGNIVLYGNKLKNFLKLYIKDIEDFYGDKSLIKEIKKYITMIDKKDRYVLMWG